MERRERGAGRNRRGGIAELRQIIEEHGAALEFDLLTMTRYQLRDVGGALPYGALLHFIRYLPRTSALSKELVPRTDTERWLDGEATAAILADIFDAIRALDADVMHKGTRRKPKPPRPYPRPWDKSKGAVHLGKDPIPIKDFEAWWNAPREGGPNHG